MPKNKNEIVALKEVRLKNKKLSKSARFPPGAMYLCVLGNGSISSPRALYMFTDHERYLFNCGEGTQRLAQEHKTKLSKLDHIFITHKSWENIGGLLGLSLTLQDMGVPELTLHGPPKMDLLFQHTKTFAVLNFLDIRTKEYTDGKFSDDCMDVHYIPIFADSVTSSSSNVEFSDDTIQYSDTDSVEPKSKRLCISPQNIKHQDMIVAYACKGHSKPGRLLREKCAELGVPPGPLLGDLKNGKDISLPCGKIIYSKDVVSKEENCPLFLVVECPSSNFLQAFVNEEKFIQYQNSSSQIASLVVHFTPPSILQSHVYQLWMNKFPSSTYHLILNSDNSTLNSAAVHRIQHKLNLLHPGMFNLLHENEVSVKWEKNQNVIQANTLERYYLRPAKGLDRSTTLNFNPEEFIEEALQTEGFRQSLENLKKNIHCHISSHTSSEIYPIVTFLGTGSSIPNKARNVSAILVKSSENRYVLLDCGEGTFSQLVRLYGRHHKKVLECLNCVFISHMHADHHLGLIKILKSRESIYKGLEIDHTPLLIVGPQKLNVWLKHYHESVEHLNSYYTFLECYDLEHIESESNDSNFEASQDIFMSTVPVNHCYDAHGVIMTQKDFKWKLVYSGDTMPCEALVAAGQNCTLLIHEATMEDELADEAVIKKHSTTSEAIKIGAAMKSSYTILTHFSQRYAKIPLFNENFHNHVGCAFDNMTICSNEMYILPLLIPTLKCLFAEDVEEMNTKGDKRRKKIELNCSMMDESTSNKILKS